MSDNYSNIEDEFSETNEFSDISDPYESLSIVETSLESSTDIRSSVSVGTEEKNGQTNEKGLTSRTVNDNIVFKLFVTLLLTLIFFGTGCGMSAVSVSLTEIHEYLSDYQTIQKKNVRLFVLFFRGIGLVLCSLFIGKIYEYSKGAKNWYHLNINHLLGFLTIILYVITLFSTPLITFAPISLFVNFFWGLGMSTMMVGATILPRAVWKTDARTAAASQSIYSFLSLGATVYSFLIGKTVKKYDNWSPRKKIFVMYYIVIIIFCIPSILGFLPPPKFETKDEKNDNNKKKSSSIFRCNFLIRDRDKLKEIWGYGDKNFFQKMFSFMKYQRQKVEILRVLFVASLSLCLFFHSSVIKCMGNLTCSYCEDRGWSRSDASFASSVFYTCFTVSRLISIFIFLFVKSSILLSLHILATSIVLVCVFVFRQYDTVIWAGFGLIGFVMSPCFAGLTILPQNFGLQLTAVELGLMLTPNGLSASTAGVAGWLMTMNKDMFFVVGNLFALLTVFMYILTILMGLILSKRNKK